VRGSVRFARTINNPPLRSRVPTHNLGGIVRIEYAADAMLARVSPFPVFLVPSTTFPFPWSGGREFDDAAAGYFVSTLRGSAAVTYYRLSTRPMIDPVSDVNQSCAALTC